MQKNIILSMFEQKLFNFPSQPDINEHAATEISQWSDLVEHSVDFRDISRKIRVHKDRNI